MSNLPTLIAALPVSEEEKRALLDAVAWRPIETAPKDGTRIIAATIGWCFSRERLDKWDLEPPKDEYRVFWVSSAQFDTARDRWTDGLEGIIPPTHWRPLDTPAPTVGPQGCDVPPPGWYCIRQHGHEGPCAAIPTQQEEDHG